MEKGDDAPRGAFDKTLGLGQLRVDHRCNEIEATLDGMEKMPSTS